MGYFNPKTETLLYGCCNYKSLDKEGNVIQGSEKKGKDCFSSLTYCTINPATSKILIYQLLSFIPYEPNIIRTYIKELNELGFPCSVEFQNETAYFYIDLNQYTKKLHFCCTLQLIRTLFEREICKTPGVYLEMIDKNKKIDKFEALQNAHKQTGGNANHKITYNTYNGSNITKEEFLARMNMSKRGVYDIQEYYDPNQRLDYLWNKEKGAIMYSTS